MGIRQILEKHPSIVTGITIVLVGIAILVGWRSLTAAGPASTYPSNYFTTDDGKTFFSAPITNIPPFETDDKQVAVQALLFSPDGTPNGAKVHLLQKYPEPVRDKFKAALAAGKGLTSVVYGLTPKDTLIKRPGDAEWLTKDVATQRGYFNNLPGKAVLAEESE
jgi:hypothetical protein